MSHGHSVRACWEGQVRFNRIPVIKVLINLASQIVVVRFQDVRSTHTDGILKKTEYMSIPNTEAHDYKDHVVVGTKINMY
jgi:hypothetical protein